MGQVVQVLELGIGCSFDGQLDGRGLQQQAQLVRLPHSNGRDLPNAVSLPRPHLDQPFVDQAGQRLADGCPAEPCVGGELTGMQLSRGFQLAGQDLPLEVLVGDLSGRVGLSVPCSGCAWPPTATDDWLRSWSG